MYYVKFVHKVSKMVQFLGPVWSIDNPRLSFDPMGVCFCVPRVHWYVFCLEWTCVRWISSIQVHSKLPSVTKTHQADNGYLLAVFGQFQCASLFSWVGVIIIQLKANLLSSGTGLSTRSELGNMSDPNPSNQFGCYESIDPVKHMNSFL